MTASIIMATISMTTRPPLEPLLSRLSIKTGDGATGGGRKRWPPKPSSNGINFQLVLTDIVAVFKTSCKFMPFEEGFGGQRFRPPPVAPSPVFIDNRDRRGSRGGLVVIEIVAMIIEAVIIHPGSHIGLFGELMSVFQVQKTVLVGGAGKSCVEDRTE